jgi:hypothetical protein
VTQVKYPFFFVDKLLILFWFVYNTLHFRNRFRD